jgi:hypothetical protein
LLHLIKLAVGVRDVAHLDALQMERNGRDPPLRHRTRSFPKRAAEILDGGSIYWVIGGAVLVRQRIIDIVPEVWADGSKGCALVFDPALVRVAGGVKKAFQGWRYLLPGEAPADLVPGMAGVAELPEEMRRALTALALL